jgi:hypothetical protein
MHRVSEPEQSILRHILTEYPKLSWQLQSRIEMEPVLGVRDIIHPDQKQRKLLHFSLRLISLISASLDGSTRIEHNKIFKSH